MGRLTYQSLYPLTRSHASPFPARACPDALSGRRARTLLMQRQHSLDPKAQSHLTTHLQQIWKWDSRQFINLLLRRLLR